MLLKHVHGIVAATLICISVQAATISGSVKGPDGAPFRGAFIRAQNKDANMTVSVLTDKTGHYKVPNLPEGKYTVQIRAVGFRSEPRPGVKLAGDQNKILNFRVAKDAVRWSDLSLYQSMQLLPPLKGKEEYVGKCWGCHGVQQLMPQVGGSEQIWRKSVNHMREIARFSLDLTDAQAEEITKYLTQIFGEHSVMPRSPTKVPGYKKTVMSFPDAAMKIIYVEYDMPGPSRMPQDANPAKDGNVWIPYFSTFNGIARLDPNTGVVKEFRVPERSPAYVHSVQTAPDGGVWFTELATNKIGKWDPNTNQINEYQDSYLTGKENMREGGSKQTVRIDSRGTVWANGTLLTNFDPRTEKFTKFFAVPSPYGIDIDKDDNVWFDEFIPEGKIYRLDATTHQIKGYQPPTAGSPRRLQVSVDGTVWFNEYRGSKIAHFDPTTETFKEYPVPGARPTPYGIGIDKEGSVWYSSEYLDVIGCLDPQTEKFTEYPVPLSENTIRELLPDSEGRLWWSSAPNNKVGYFYLGE